MLGDTVLFSRRKANPGTGTNIFSISQREEEGGRGKMLPGSCLGMDLCCSQDVTLRIVSGHLNLILTPGLMPFSLHTTYDMWLSFFC